MIALLSITCAAVALAILFGMRKPRTLPKRGRRREPTVQEKLKSQLIRKD